MGIVEIVQKKDEKLKKLWPLLKQSKARKTIIFALYKKECAWLHTMLKKDGYDVGCLHGDMSQDQRNRSIEDFKKNNIPMLIATDVAGRGLDVQDVELVVNYTFPLTIEDYIHRIGRTGRAGKTGRSSPTSARTIRHQELMRRPWPTISSRCCLMRNRMYRPIYRRLRMVQEDRKQRRKKRIRCTALTSRMKPRWRNWKPRKRMSHLTIQTTIEKESLPRIRRVWIST